MERMYCGRVYSSQRFDDTLAGCAGLDLAIIVGQERKGAARVTYWDATGQYVVETFREVPLQILEELIAETKQSVGVD